MWASVVIPDSSGLEINNVTLNFNSPFCFYLLSRMDVVWVLFFWCFSLIFATDDGLDINGTEATSNKQKLELFPPPPTYAGQTRMPRAFFKKLHSGAAFLTGLKLGAILSKKGFELGHGKIASTHSFQIFGKSVNSAMSLSYGNPGSLLPLVDDVPQTEDSLKRTDLKNEDEKIFQVTIVENPFNKSVEALQALHSQIEKKKEEDEEGDRINESTEILYKNSIGEEPETEIKSDFIKEHNKIVNEFNERILKRKKVNYN